MPTHDLATGSSRLLDALKAKFSDLNDVELERMASAFESELSKRIAAGEQIAFVRPAADGKMEITVLSLEVKQQMESESKSSKHDKKAR